MTSAHPPVWTLTGRQALWDGMGWDRLVGTGVATALKIVQWPTPFLTRHSALSVGRGYSNEQSPPRSRAYRRVHTDRSDPTILQYSVNVATATSQPVKQKPYNLITL